jgi:hypothetical protein
MVTALRSLDTEMLRELDRTPVSMVTATGRLSNLSACMLAAMEFRTIPKRTQHY